mgnify:CR=1 FL=1
MDPFVFSLVLMAAVFHASWNALLKKGDDPWTRLAISNLIGMGIGIALIPFVEFPNAEAWPFIIGSTIIHQTYYITVSLQYRFGDLSHVYPISRGSAPLLVAAGAFLFVGETLPPAGIAAVILISAAIISLTFSTAWKPGEGKGVLFALLTGTNIAVYTVIDGQGGRLANDVLGYIVYLFIIDAIPFAFLVGYMRRDNLASAVKNNLKTGTMTGLMAFPAYGLVIWAMSLSPLTYVSALRETSVILAVLIGTKLLGEPFGTRRVIAATAVVIGVVVLQAN